MTAPRRFRSMVFLAAAMIAVITISSLLLSAPADSANGEKRVSIYSLVANYSVLVVQRDGQDYVGLLDAVEPLGAVSATVDGSHWRLHYNNQQAEFTAGSNHARVRQSDFDLHANFLLENGRGLVPVATLGPLMSHILGGPVTFHEAARRVFVGSVAIHFTAQVNKATPRSLVMNFTSPVNPMIATEPGKLRMVFGHDPLVEPGSPSLTFDDSIIPSAIYSEDNGAAEVTISGTAPLFASFSNGNRTITITPSSPATTQNPATVAGTQTQAAAGSPNQPPGAPAAQTPASPAQFFVVVDASHGGTERGEALTAQLAEKDVTLAFARALRQELQNRGLSTLVLRDDDATLTADQRASLANGAHPAIYICLHASSQGHGVRLYTTLLPSRRENAGPFVSWDTAQSSFLPLSRSAASGLALELQKKQIQVRVLTAPLRPLNNIASAALAVEVAPGSAEVSELNSGAYQQLVASSVANGVVVMRGQLGPGR